MHDSWTKADLPFLARAMDTRPQPHLIANDEPSNAVSVVGDMSIPKPVTVDVNGTMSAQDYKACSFIMAVCQNIVQKSITEQAEAVGVSAPDALKNMTAWVQGYVHFPFPFFNFKEMQSDNYKKDDFSLNANPEVVESIVNIKNVGGLKDAVIGALKNSGGELAHYKSEERHFKYFGVITGYNDTEIAIRVIKFEMNLSNTVVDTLCGGASTTTLDTTYETYVFVGDKEMMIKMQEKAESELVDYFVKKLTKFIEDFYDSELRDYKTLLAKALRPAS